MVETLFAHSSAFSASIPKGKPLRGSHGIVCIYTHIHLRIAIFPMSYVAMLRQRFENKYKPSTKATFILELKISLAVHTHVRTSLVCIILRQLYGLYFYCTVQVVIGGADSRGWTFPWMVMLCLKYLSRSFIAVLKSEDSGLVYKNLPTYLPT